MLLHNLFLPFSSIQPILCPLPPPLPMTSPHIIDSQYMAPFVLFVQNMYVTKILLCACLNTLIQHNEFLNVN